LFPFSLEGAAQIWLEKEPPRSILTWDNLVTKFINQFFTLSKTTNLRNVITRFQQRFDESFYEAWDHFNDLLRAYLHHRFSELHQLDTFYNALNVNDQDSLNSAAGVIAKVSTSSSTLAISSDVAELKDMVRALLLDKKNQSSAPAHSLTPASVKAVKPNCVTCGVDHGSTTVHADIFLPDLEYFNFDFKPVSGEVTSIVDFEIRKNVPSVTKVNLPPGEDHSHLFDYVVWIFLSFLTYPLVPPHLLSFRNEDMIFDPGIANYHFPYVLPDVSHRNRFKLSDPKQALRGRHRLS
nr:reverse transcriptase domain-containing protein [Tanacetum cinerariifolium]